MALLSHSACSIVDLGPPSGCAWGAGDRTTAGSAPGAPSARAAQYLAWLEHDRVRTEMMAPQRSGAITTLREAVCSR